MDVHMLVQGTPNPNALKFVLNVPVRRSGRVTYKSAGECGGNPLAAALFALPGVREVFFYDNYITVTQDGTADWNELEERVKATIRSGIENHDPDFPVPQSEEASSETPADPELARIDAILEETVRPALRMDGGDLQLVSLEGNVLKIHYQGACGSCPSATFGTLRAIESLLKDQYNADIVVELA